MKRYQIEASSQVTPARVKQLTELQRARARVVEILKEEEERRAEEKQVEEQDKSEMNIAHTETSEDVEVEAARETRDEEGRSQQDKTQNQQSMLESTVRETQGVQKECAGADVQALKGNDKNSTEAGKSELGLAKGSPEGKDMSLRLRERSVQENETEVGIIERVKRQKWTPDPGFRRCGHQCLGCALKCAEQGIEDCQNCHLNKTKKKNNNPCANRKECTDPKPAMMQKPKASGKKNSQLTVSKKEDKLEKSPRSSSLVGNQLVEYVPDHVEGQVKIIEKNSVEGAEEDLQGDKRRREEGGTPEDQKRVSKVAMSKFGGASKIAQPTLLQNLIK